MAITGPLSSQQPPHPSRDEGRPQVQDTDTSIRQSTSRNALPGAWTTTRSLESIGETAQAKPAREMRPRVDHGRCQAHEHEHEHDVGSAAGVQRQSSLHRTITYAPLPVANETEVSSKELGSDARDEHGYCGHSPDEYKVLEKHLMLRLDIRLACAVGVLVCLVAYGGGLLGAAAAAATTINVDLDLLAHDRYVSRPDV